MIKVYLKQFLLLLFINIASLNSDARPSLYDLDSIFTYSDFCDEVEVLYYDSFQLSVKSKLDSRTYTFFTNSFRHENFPNPSSKYLLVRGRISSDLNSKTCIVLGELIRNNYVFYKHERNFCCYTSSNPIAQIDNPDKVDGQIKYPKTYFRYKTPSFNWTEQEQMGNKITLLSNNPIEINFEKYHSQFINDTIHIYVENINNNHLKLTMHLRSNKIYGEFDSGLHTQSILKSIGLSHNDILEGSNNSTIEDGWNYCLFSYSNEKYKLITYKIYYAIKEEEIIVINIHK